ncbi:membrane bound O-acyl transferase family-domain-containing protein [Gymnopilus junonius]|uniref:Membrane bound O-acyl transferase family-domain-containing protein n=1 Tax=Gymnopilus junonius TaxID=109634 RepID=A0A9P5NT99_GYMJU|nr:membrane bound O-acyl transferase family-domain-containing protein [Gymnopilus junonius]
MAEGRIPFDGPLYGLSQLGLIIGTIPGLPKPISYILLLPILWISYHLITRTSTGDLSADVALGSAILTQLLIGLDAMFFTNPDTLTNYQEPRLKGEKITEQSLKERLQFAFNLYTNPRGIGWAHEHRHLPSRPSPSTPRSKFVLIRLSTALLCALLEFIAYTANASNPGTTTPGRGLRDAAIQWRALGVLAFATAGAARICALNCLVSAGVVGLGFSSPERWPRLFGSALDAWSVQRFWRRVWHQLLRKSLISATTSLLSAFSVSPLSRASSLPAKFAFLYTAFFIIGVVHIGGEYMLLGRWEWNGAFAFFQLQAVGITIEKIVAWVWSQTPGHGRKEKDDRTHIGPDVNGNAQSNGKNDKGTPNGAALKEKATDVDAVLPALWVRFIGYIWVASWFVWSLAFMIDPMTTTGMFADPRVDLRRKLTGWASN